MLLNNNKKNVCTSKSTQARIHMGIYWKKSQMYFKVLLTFILKSDKTKIIVQSFNKEKLATVTMLWVYSVTRERLPFNVMSIKW